MKSKGLYLNHDMFSHGNTANGCGHVPRTVHQGVRTTAADFITKKNRRDNIDIMVKTHVDKVIIGKDYTSELKATGVRAVRADGSVVEVMALKEVIVSGGAYCSPIILNRSGVGDYQELEKHGIPLRVHLPGVGKNLMDHLVC